MVDEAPGQADGVVPVCACELRATGEAWTYACDHAQAIDDNWDQVRTRNPEFFNGTIYLMVSCALKGDVFQGTFLKTDFKSYLFWRSRGFEEAGVRDVFGSGVIRSCEGYVILGRQAEGHVNSGLAYMPGGFIDPRDVTPNGRIDVDASIRREMLEETGLDATQMARAPGYYLTFHDKQISIAVVYQSQLSADVLRNLILRYIAAQTTSELADVEVVTERPRAAQEGFAPFAVRLLGALLPANSKKD